MLNELTQHIEDLKSLEAEQQASIARLKPRASGITAYCPDCPYSEQEPCKANTPDCPAEQAKR